MENVADNIMRQIARLDHTNEYILYVNEFAKDFYKETGSISKVVVGRLASTQIVKTFWLFLFYPIISFFNRIDITLIFSGTNNFSLSPFTKNVIYIHDLGEFYVHGKYDKKRMFYRKYMMLPINKFMGDVFIAVSNATRKAIIDILGIDSQRIKVIYNGVDDRIKVIDKVAAKTMIVEKYGLDNSIKFIATVGRIDPVGKNLLKLVESVDILATKRTDFHFFLIGESNFPNAHLVWDEVRRRGLGRFITFTGYVDADELNAFYGAVDMLVFPSVHEGFGLPILEAMKCNLPVACSDIDVFHEVGSDGVVYFDPLDPNDIADKLSLIMDDNELRGKLVGKGKEILARFSWESSAKKLLEVLNSV